MVPRALTIASVRLGRRRRIQADLKAFAAAGCYGMSAIVALTAQNTIGVTAVHELPPAFVRAQLEAVFDDIGVDAAKTGMLFSRAADRDRRRLPREHPVPLVVDPVMVASSGRGCCRTTPSRRSSRASSRSRRSLRRTCPRRRRSPGDGHASRAGRAAASSSAPPAALVTGGHGDAAVDHLFDGRDTSRSRSTGTRSGRPTAPAARTRRRSPRCSPAAVARAAAAARQRAASEPSSTGWPSSGRATARSTSST